MTRTATSRSPVALLLYWHARCSMPNTTSTCIARIAGGAASSVAISAITTGTLQYVEHIIPIIVRLDNTIPILINS